MSPVFMVFNLTVIDLMVVALAKISSYVKKLFESFLFYPGLNLSLWTITSLVSVLLVYLSITTIARRIMRRKAISDLKISDYPLAHEDRVTELIVETVKELK